MTLVDVTQVAQWVSLDGISTCLRPQVMTLMVRGGNLGPSSLLVRERTVAMRGSLGPIVGRRGRARPIPTVSRDRRHEVDGATKRTRIPEIYRRLYDFWGVNVFNERSFSPFGGRFKREVADSSFAVPLLTTEHGGPARTSSPVGKIGQKGARAVTLSSFPAGSTSTTVTSGGKAMETPAGRMSVRASGRRPFQGNGGSPRGGVFTRSFPI